MLRRVRLHAIPIEIRAEILEFFSRRQNFAFEILQDCAIIHLAWWCSARLRSAKVPSNCAERQHAAAREIARDSELISDKNFEILRGREIFRSKSREIAPKSAACGGLKPRREP